MRKNRTEIHILAVPPSKPRPQTHRSSENGTELPIPYRGIPCHSIVSPQKNAAACVGFDGDFASGKRFGLAEVADRAGVEKHVADVGHTRNVHHQSVEAQAETAVGARAELAQVEVVTIGVQIHIALVHGGQEFVEVGLTLAAADDLAHAGHQEVGSGDGLAVGILLHIEGLDGLGIVDNEHGLVVDDLGDIALVFGLQIATPVVRILELHALLGRFVQQLDGVRVVQNGKLVVDDIVEFVQQPFLEVLLEEREFGGALGHQIGNDVFDHAFGQLDDVGQLGESHLGLEVPKLGQVARGVALFGAERRAEGVDFAHRHGGDFALQLAGHAKPRLLAEEIVGVILLFRLVGGGEGMGGDTEDLARALAIATRDKRSVDIAEMTRLEEGVQRARQHRTHAEYGVEGIGAQAKLGNGAQILQGVAFLLQGIVQGALAQYDHLVGVDFHAALVSHGVHHLARHLDGDAQPQEGRDVGELRFVQHDLQMRQSRAVVEAQKRHILAVATAAHPAANVYRLPVVSFCQNVCYINVFHNPYSCIYPSLTASKFISNAFLTVLRTAVCITS